MKNENTHLTRRNFISKGAAVAAASSIICIERLEAPASETAKRDVTSLASQPLTNDPVFTDSAQTLTNKTIASRLNTLGTDYVNIREYYINPLSKNITAALNSAISALSQPGSYGGQILIPHGSWYSDGGHELGNNLTVNPSHSISIEGAGFNFNPGYWGTEIKLTSGGQGPSVDNRFMFRVSADGLQCSLKNLAIDLRSDGTAAGLILTNHHGATVTGALIRGTCLENVGFNGGSFGIKVDSTAAHFQCDLNRFERVSFIGCNTAFYCNSINGGYSFDSCNFTLGTGQTAFDCKFMGYLAVEHCLFEGGYGNTGGNTILNNTWDGTNNWAPYYGISFYDCQDEGIEFYYKNIYQSSPSTNFDWVPIVLRSCLIQSKFQLNANGAVVLDSCHVASIPQLGTFLDSATGYLRLYLQGFNNFFSASAPTGAKIGTFQNSSSRIIYGSTEIGIPEINSATGTIHGARGLVTIQPGQNFIDVPNNLVTSTSLVFTQLMSTDPMGARIREVQCSSNSFRINLTQNASTPLNIAWKIEA